MMIMLRDDSVIEVFESPLNPPKGIEGIDIENNEYQFCSDSGQRFIGKITEPAKLFRDALWVLQVEGTADASNALALIDQAKDIEPNPHFGSLAELREHCLGTGNASR